MKPYSKNDPLHWARIALIVLMLVGLVYSAVGMFTEEAERKRIAETPAGRFCAIINEARARYEAASADQNRLRGESEEGAARTYRRDALRFLLPDSTVTEWVGTITEIDNGIMEPGSASFALDLGCGVQLRETIQPGSPFLQMVPLLDVGSRVGFSGTFVASSNADEPFAELSLTERGGMLEPEFLFEFSKLAGVYR